MWRLVAALCFWCGGATAGPLLEMRLDDGRAYFIALPAQPRGAPLILALHGGGGSPRQFAADSGLTARAVAAGFAIAYPEGTGRRLLSWNAETCCGPAQAQGVDDSDFLIRVAEDAAKGFGVAGERVYLTGMSNGAMLAQLHALRHPGRVAAVVSVAGVAEVRRYPPRGAVPLLHIHGTSDPLVPYDGGPGFGLVTAEQDFPSVDRVIVAFRQPQGLLRQGRSTMIDKAEDGMQVRRDVWEDRAGTPRVVVLSVIGGGHHWPGGGRSDRRGATQDIDASTEAIAFFQAHH
jgi:polyhydroxybutyrate depolymerase